MAFSLTIAQMRAKQKTVTRRLGWWDLEPCTILCAVEKCMGLKRGEKIVRIGHIEVVSTRPEPLYAITQEDVVREGFPSWTPPQFIDFLCKKHKINPNKIVNRIEFMHAML